METRLDNILVPKHEILSPEDAERILEFYGVTPEEFPRIKQDDPGLVRLKVNAGDIIRITRNSPTAGKSFYYRVVI